MMISGSESVETLAFQVPFVAPIACFMARSEMTMSGSETVETLALLVPFEASGALQMGMGGGAFATPRWIWVSTAGGAETLAFAIQFDWE